MLTSALRRHLAAAAACAAVSPALAQTAAVDALLTRPLFSATRRPPPAGLGADPVTDKPAPPPRLAGTVISGADRRVALLALPPANKLRTAHVGETIGRYRITAIGPGEVRADSPAGPLVLRMGTSRTTPVPSLAPPPAGDPHRATGAVDQDE